MPRDEFERELALQRQYLLRMAARVESQIALAIGAMRDRDRAAAAEVQQNDQEINELFRQIREACYVTIGTQQPVARDLRTLMGVLYIATELERMGDYAVRIARMAGTLAGLPEHALQPEFEVLGQLASTQVHDILDALIRQDEPYARAIAGRDDEVDRLYHRLFDDLIQATSQGVDADGALRNTTLLLIAHNLERIADRVTNVAEDIVFLATGQVVELG